MVKHWQLLIIPNAIVKLMIGKTLTNNGEEITNDVTDDVVEI